MNQDTPLSIRKQTVILSFCYLFLMLNLSEYRNILDDISIYIYICHVVVNCFSVDSFSDWALTLFFCRKWRIKVLASNRRELKWVNLLLILLVIPKKCLDLWFLSWNLNIPLRCNLIEWWVNSRGIGWNNQYIW